MFLLRFYMNSKEAIKIAKEVARELKKANFTESMYIIGSLSTGHFDKYADVDIIITTNKKVYSKDVFPIVKNFMTEKVYEDNKFPYRIDAEIKKLKIMLFFILEEWVLPGIKQNKKAGEHEYSKHKDLIRLKKAIILFDKKSKFRNLLKNVPEIPFHIKKYTLHERIHKLNYYLFLDNGAINTARKRKNYFEVQASIIDVIQNIYECIYAINGKTKVDRKWAIEDIKKFKKKPRGIEKRLNVISQKGNSKKELDEKINILRKIAKELKPFIEKEGIKDLPDLKVPK